MRPRLKTEDALNLNRRGFIQLTSAAAGGLLISLYLDKPLLAQQAPPPIGWSTWHGKGVDTSSR